MKKWRVRFHGRAVNAQGIFDWHTVTVEADTKEEALIRIYDTHEHLSAHERERRAVEVWRGRMDGAGGKTSRELERALTFDYKHEAEEAARFMTEIYALSEFKPAKRG